MKKHFISISIILLFTSCQPILRTVTGIKKPQFESYNSIETYIQENKLSIEPNRNYFLTKNSGYESLSKFRNRYFRLPDIYIFNSNGQFLEENEFCTSLKIQLSDKPNENYYEKILKIDSLVSDNKSISDLEQMISNSKGQPANFEDNKNTAIILWAKFLGKKNKKYISEAKMQLENLNDSINIYYLNIDTLESWPEK